MSIEWLLTKTTGTKAQSGPTKTSHKQDELSGKTHDLKSSKQKQATEEIDEERPCGVEYTSSAKMQNRTSEINFRCRCGYAELVNNSTTDFKLLRTDSKGFIYFECPNCKRHLRHNLSTGTIKIKKGFLGFLLGKFS